VSNKSYDKINSPDKSIGQTIMDGLEEQCERQDAVVNARERFLEDYKKQLEVLRLGSCHQLL